MRKVDINIRQLVHGHAVAVEETAEVEVETDGADPGNAETVADEGVGRRTSGDPVNPAAAAFLQQIPDEEKVVSVTDLADDPQFLGQLAQDPPVQGGLGAVTATGTVDHEAAEKVLRSRVIRRVEMGEAQAAEIEREGTLFGEAEGFTERPGIAAAAAEGFGRGGKREVTPAFAGIGLTGPGEGTDGLDNLVGGGFPWMEISNFGKKERSRGEGIPAPRGPSG